MNIKQLFFIVVICFLTGYSYAQPHSVKLRVVDKTFGLKTSNDKSTSEKNVVAMLSDKLKALNSGTYYPMYKQSGTTGEIIKSDTAWVWQATIQVPVGEHWWYPAMRLSASQPMNRLSVYYGEDDKLKITVDESGKVSGTTELIITDTQYPVTIKVIDKSKGGKTNSGNFDEANMYIEGSKPASSEYVRTNLHEEFIVHNATPEFSDTHFDFGSGVNIGVWLSQTSNRGGTAENYFKKSDLKKLADMGFDHIRLPVDEAELFNTDLSFKNNIKDLIHSAISWCQEYDMRVILDMHILRSHYFNDDKNSIKLWKDLVEQDKFVQIWDKLSQEFNAYPNSILAYELLNEANAPNDQVWNDLSARIIAKIREREPNRMLVLGGISHNSAGALASLNVPENDKNIALAFHFYSPHLLTHYQASWMNGLKDLVIPLHYPGQLVKQEDLEKLTESRHINAVQLYNGYYNKAVLKDKIQVAINRASALGLKLYCSEYGCISNTNKEIKYRWMKDIAEVFRENDIAFSVWGWKANFGILDNSGNIRDQRVIDEISRGGGKLYNLFLPDGGLVEKNDTAWIWSATMQARTGSYTWRPSLYSENKPVNETIYHYDSSPESNGFLQFNVALDGTVSGCSELIIPAGGTSISKAEDCKEIEVYPTLFDTYINVIGAKSSIEIYNVLGTKLQEREVDSAVTIDTSSFPQGIYFLLIDRNYTYKLKK